MSRSTFLWEARIAFSNGGQTPILVISSDPDLGAVNSGTPASVEAALDSGADDFVSSSTITLNVNESIVIRNGDEIHLHPMEFNLLEFLLRHPNQVFTARTLHERVWRGQVNRASSSDTVRTHIKTLRKKIDIPGTKSLITSVQGRGYKLSL
ncbi:MAG: winged helix-turn-helix domain-containing protein [Candidatus Obscuribacterales bacterium]|nr:winged helix-turn-helix domain-containing protein [Candidatus Obscuribacterales bacterium]